MLTAKKIQALIETFLWLVVVVLMICTLLPVTAMLTLAGFVLRMFHVEFVSEFAGRVMNMMIVFIKFVTRRIRMRTNEIEALRTK